MMHRHVEEIGSRDMVRTGGRLMPGEDHTLTLQEENAHNDNARSKCLDDPGLHHG